MLIGLNGKLKSGKDTTFTVIQEYFPHATKVSFAERLKVSAAAALGMPREMMEALKNDETINLILDGDDQAYH